MFRQPADPAQRDEVADLPEGDPRAGRPTPGKAPMDALHRGEGGHDEVGVAIGAGVQNNSGRFPFHGQLEVFAEARHEFDEVAGPMAAIKLRHQNVVPAIADRAGAAG